MAKHRSFISEFKAKVVSEVDLSDYEDYADAYRQIGQFLKDVYNHKRIHSALGYLTPSEFETQ